MTGSFQIRGAEGQGRHRRHRRQAQPRSGVRSRRYQRNAAIARCGRINHRAARRKNVVQAEGALSAGGCGALGLAVVRGGLLCRLYGAGLLLRRRGVTDGQQCGGEYNRRYQGECRDHDSCPCQGPALAAGAQVHGACNKGDESQWRADKRQWHQEKHACGCSDEGADRQPIDAESPR